MITLGQAQQPPAAGGELLLDSLNTRMENQSVVQEVS